MMEVLSHDLFIPPDHRWPCDEISDALESLFGADDYNLTVKFDIPSLPAHILPPAEEQPTIPSCDAPLSHLVKSLSMDSDISGSFGLAGYPTPLATPAQSVPSSPTLSPCRSPRSKSSPECIDPIKLFSFDANDDSDIEIDVVTVDEERNGSLKRPSGANGATAANKNASPKKLKTSSSAGSSASSLTTSSPGVDDDDLDLPQTSKNMDIETRRHVHNVLERRRREDLKASFDGLRICIPELEHNDKSPKVTILQGATDFIAKLKQKQADLLSSKGNLSSENARLLTKLRQLQTQLSAM